MSQIVETKLLGQLIVLETVPRSEIANINRVEFCQFFFRRRCKEIKILLADTASFNDFLIGNTTTDAIVNLVTCRIGLNTISSTIFPTYIFTIDKKRGIIPAMLIWEPFP